MEITVRKNEGKIIIEIPEEKLKGEINIDGIDYLLCPKTQLDSLLNILADYKKDIAELHTCIVAVLDLMGLYDHQTHDIKEGIKTGKDSYFKYILRALGDVVSLLTQAKLGFKGAEQEILEKFAFIKNILPLIEKHGRKQRTNEPARNISSGNRN